MAEFLQDLLAASALRHPSREAVWHKGGCLSYGELHSASNRLARCLRECGVARGDRVGVYLPKGLEAVTAIFGILKAGAAYVPLDPLAPAVRSAFIIENCAMKALVTTHSRLRDLAPLVASAGSLAAMVSVDQAPQGASLPWPVTEWRDLEGFPDEAPAERGRTPEDLAYILYTSGSTGRPKGVMISHRAALAFVEWARDCFALSAGDRVSNHAPLHFDLSTFDLFSSVAAGAAVVLVPPELSAFPLDLARFIEERGITVWYSVPSVLVQLVSRGDLTGRRFPSLRAVLFAGEIFPMPHLRLLAEQLPGAELHNLYGPTETNVCTWHRVDRRALAEAGETPIGVAASGDAIELLGPGGAPVADGEEGELTVCGPSVMSGYWGLPEQTARVLTGTPAGPVYRTGDMARRGRDGNFYFLGRRDGMIKKLGYRIELEEIESILRGHPDLAEAAVIATADTRQGARITAVAVRARGAAGARELERYCAERIPAYMIPDAFEFRDALPRTSTGKIDRARLREDAASKGESLCVKSPM